MTQANIKQLYMDLSENVRALSSAREGLLRDINHQIRRGDDFQVLVRTKMLALLYSAWSESQFLQIAHTPHAFRWTEIEKIKQHKNQHGTERGWEYMLEEAFKRAGDIRKNKDLANRLKTLLDIIKAYVGTPTRIRNKIAHGQWIVALNRRNTARNEKLTKEIESLDPVLIEKQFEVHRVMGLIVRDLVQSPIGGFHRHYWVNVTELQTYLKKTQNWTVETKRAKLLLKPIRRGGARR